MRGRQDILELYLQDKPLSEDVDVKAIARGTPGFNGAGMCSSCFPISQKPNHACAIESLSYTNLCNLRWNKFTKTLIIVLEISIYLAYSSYDGESGRVFWFKTSKRREKMGGTLKIWFGLNIYLIYVKVDKFQATRIYFQIKQSLNIY